MGIMVYSFIMGNAGFIPSAVVVPDHTHHLPQPYCLGLSMDALETQQTQRDQQRHTEEPNTKVPKVPPTPRNFAVESPQSIDNIAARID